MSEKQSTPRPLCLLVYGCVTSFLSTLFSDKVIEYSTRRSGDALDDGGWLDATEEHHEYRPHLSRNGLDHGGWAGCWSCDVVHAQEVAPMAVGFALGWLIDQIRSRRFRIVEVLAGTVCDQRADRNLFRVLCGATITFGVSSKKSLSCPLPAHFRDPMVIVLDTAVWSAGHLTLALVPCVIALGRTSRRFEPVQFGCLYVDVRTAAATWFCLRDEDCVFAILSTTLADPHRRQSLVFRPHYTPIGKQFPPPHLRGVDRNHRAHHPLAKHTLGLGGIAAGKDVRRLA